MEEQSCKKRVRNDSDESPEVKRIREDLLDFLYESDTDPAAHDIESVMKSFEDEISSSRVPVIDLTPDSGKSKTELGFLFEASDDELGLPPPSINSTREEVTKEEAEMVGVESGEWVDAWGYEEDVASYEWLEVVRNYNYSEYVGLGEGLFDYCNVCFDSSDVSWGLGTMPAE